LTVFQLIITADTSIMSNAFVDFDQVYLAYDEEGGYAVEDISLSVREKEFIAIVGPSGCGKSTLAHPAKARYWPKAGKSPAR
jgi:NitT/TauT family transport system ATP-binding protein